MVTVVEGQESFRRLDHVAVPLPDGTSLAARIWVPDSAHSHPVPAILEYIPYRKNDLFAVSDHARYGYFAAHGYAGVRLDIRGSGDSDGVLADEYAPQEQDDAVAAIAWIAAQPWCSGAIGMIGKSWGGFNALQIAARRPPALKAVVSVYSTDDRYATNAQYMGGCLLTTEMLGWGTKMHTVATLPPDPHSVGERWKALWEERLKAFYPQTHTWLNHQHRDAYWKHGSVCEDFDAIQCPVYSVGGWFDGYRDTVFRLMAGLPGAKKGLIGPWSHRWPMDPFEPGPHIGFLQECIRFFDTYLKGCNTAIIEEPLLRVFIQDPVRPATHYAIRPGRWAAEPSWPSPNIHSRRMYLNGNNSLGETSDLERPLEVIGAQVSGQDAGDWCPYGGPLDGPPDQRAEDGMSLSFTSSPLTESAEILGNPVVQLSLSADRPRALVAVRLCDIWPDGASTLLSCGLLNLTHYQGHEQPEALRPGLRFEARVALPAIGQLLPIGHRIRVSVSPTYFPWAWPSPQPATLTLFAGACFIDLPIRGSSSLDHHLTPFAPPETGPKLEAAYAEVAPLARTVSKDPLSGRVETQHCDPVARVRLRDGLEIQETDGFTFEITEGDPLSARYRVERAVALRRGRWDTRLEAETELTADLEQFYLQCSIRAFDDGQCFFDRTWTLTSPREFV
jgi:uncharacterized protein